MTKLIKTIQRPFQKQCLVRAISFYITVHRAACVDLSMRSLLIILTISWGCRCCLHHFVSRCKSLKNYIAPVMVITVFWCPFCLLQAQFLNLLLCRCFQLSYLEKHPEEAQEDSAASVPRRNPSLLNHGFPLSVSALVSFRRAPFRGLLLGSKVWTWITSSVHFCNIILTQPQPLTLCFQLGF